MYDQVVKCQRAGLCLSEHFLIVVVVIFTLGSIDNYGSIDYYYYYY